MYFEWNQLRVSALLKSSIQAVLATLALARVAFNEHHPINTVLRVHVSMTYIQSVSNLATIIFWQAVTLGYRLSLRAGDLGCGEQVGLQTAAQATDSVGVDFDLLECYGLFCDPISQIAQKKCLPLISRRIGLSLLCHLVLCP